jgi:hypothetical protein
MSFGAVCDVAKSLIENFRRGGSRCSDSDNCILSFGCTALCLAQSGCRCRMRSNIFFPLKLTGSIEQFLACRQHLAAIATAFLVQLATLHLLGIDNLSEPVARCPAELEIKDVEDLKAGTTISNQEVHERERRLKPDAPLLGLRTVKLGGFYSISPPCIQAPRS